MKSRSRSWNWKQKLKLVKMFWVLKDHEEFKDYVFTSTKVIQGMKSCIVFKTTFLLSLNTCNDKSWQYTQEEIYWICVPLFTSVRHFYIMQIYWKTHPATAFWETFEANNLLSL